MTSRYAIYYAPARNSPWWAFGAHWLGRDESNGSALPQPACSALAAAAFQRITEPPRRYGFHATLKAPFRLHAHSSTDALLARVQSLAGELDGVELGPLVPVFMAAPRPAEAGRPPRGSRKVAKPHFLESGFVALVPARANPSVNALAQACVTGLDDLREPFSNAEIERRAEALDARGLELLQRFGYPHVMERFRFHMTLTGPIDLALARELIAQLVQPLAQLNAQAPARLDRLCIFVEPAPGAPFQRMADAMLALRSTAP